MKQGLARIQRLCCLGLGGEMLMPDLMQEVMELIPSRQAVFFWLGADLEIANAYTTIPASYVEVLRTEFYARRREWDYFRSPKELMKAPLPNNVQRFDQILHTDHRAFLCSDYYNLVFRPLGADEPLMLRVRDGGRNQGILYNFAAGSAPFGGRDVSLLELVAGFIAHGMTRATVREDALTDSDNRALFIADRDGTIRHASPQARQLLIVALNPRRAPRLPEIEWRSLREPAPEVAYLCRALAATAAGEIGQSPPVLRIASPFGEFVLRAYWLEPTDGTEQTRHIGITIERRVPRALAVFRRVESLELTAREKQLCLLLARDLPLQELADALGLAAGTVVSHQRSVYAKLGVHSRAELLTAITPV